jgi:serine/threonine protein kinase
VFALGLVALECLTRRHPFVGADASPGAIVCSALSSEPVPLPTPGGAQSGQCGGVAVQALLDGEFSDPCDFGGFGSFGGGAAGPTWGSAGGCGGSEGGDQVLLSPECLDWLRAALEKDPTKRATAEQLLGHPWMAAELAPAQVEAACGAAVTDEVVTAAAAAAAKGSAMSEEALPKAAWLIRGGSRAM